MAAGGNIETTKPGEIYVHNGVTHIGLTDLPSQLANTASSLFSNNVTKLILDMEDKDDKDNFSINLNNDITRGSIVLQNGKLMWPRPADQRPTPPTPAPKKTKAAGKAEVVVDPFKRTMNRALTTTGALGGLLGMVCRAHLSLAF